MVARMVVLAMASFHKMVSLAIEYRDMFFHKMVSLDKNQYYGCTSYCVMVALATSSC